MVLTVNDKNYDIKFGYIATVKSGIINKLSEVSDDENGGEKIEKAMILAPELLLVGLQKNHRDEFGYNYDTLEGHDEAFDKACEIVEAFLEEDGDFGKLLNDLQEELVNNSFLSNMLQGNKKASKKK